MRRARAGRVSYDPGMTEQPRRICPLADLQDPASLGFSLQTSAGPLELFLVRRGTFLRSLPVTISDGQVCLSAGVESKEHE